MGGRFACLSVMGWHREWGGIDYEWGGNRFIGLNHCIKPSSRKTLVLLALYILCLVLVLVLRVCITMLTDGASSGCHGISTYVYLWEISLLLYGMCGMEETGGARLALLPAASCTGSIR